MQAQGRVSYVGSKPYGSKVLWSLRLQNNDAWFNCGERDPNVKSGDNVEFEYTVNPNGKSQVSIPTVRVLAGATATTVTQSQPSSSFKGNGKEEYWENRAADDKLKDLRIQHQSARNAAIEVVGILVSKDLLTLPGKNASEAVLGKISDLTERFYKETTDVTSETDAEPSAEAA